jgi:hypothetical protein
MAAGGEVKLSLNCFNGTLWANILITHPHSPLKKKIVFAPMFRIRSSGVILWKWLCNFPKQVTLWPRLQGQGGVETTKPRRCLKHCPWGEERKLAVPGPFRDVFFNRVSYRVAYGALLMNVTSGRILKITVVVYFKIVKILTLRRATILMPNISTIQGKKEIKTNWNGGWNYVQPYFEIRRDQTMKSCVFWNITPCICWTSTDVSEKHVTFIFSV